MNEQQKARVVELAKRAESDMKARAWHREGGYHVFADIMTHDFIRPASAEAFRIAQDAAALRALVDAGYAPVSALVEQEARQ